MENIKLTEFSHGAGCGCKIAPDVLEEILGESDLNKQFESLLVGNSEKDDAAVFQINEDQAVVSTTDFFMPIVDDAFDFGAISSANAISDVYAMGAKPIMAIAILAWPINKIPISEAARVLEGARSICQKAGIPLAGGHSIDAPEPIFGLSVNGIVNPKKLRRNSDAKIGDKLFLTKPIGIGLISTAQKKKLAREEDLKVARDSMLSLNTFGAELDQIEGIGGLTDVTGFGLAGHLIELAEASNGSAFLNYKDIPKFDCTDYYLNLKAIAGGTERNWAAYGDKVVLDDKIHDYRLIADPQTSGPLLISINESNVEELIAKAKECKQDIWEIGELGPKEAKDLVLR